MAADEVRLDLTDAVELIEVLRFLGDWLSHDSEVLTGSLHRFVGSSGYDLEGLRADLDRFAFLLGDDGERLFGPPHQ